MVGRIPLSATSDRDYPSSYPHALDEDVTRPMCGQGVLNKILLKKSSSPAVPSPGFRSASQHQSTADTSRSCIAMGPNKGGMPFSRRRYEEVTRHLLASPEDTESSSTSSDKSHDDAAAQPTSSSRHAAASIPGAPESSSSSNSFIVQFVHGLEGNGPGSPMAPAGTPSATPSPQRQLHLQPLGFSRTGLWSSPLPAVTEETSSVETEETPRERELGGGGGAHHASPSAAATGPSAAAATAGSVTKYTSPEKNEMLAAMRNLVLKQQAALKELSKENTHYRKKMEDYQNTIIKMKRVQAEQDGRIAQLQLEKEAFETEAMWLRGQIESMSRDVEIDDDEVQQKLRNLMLGGSDALTPSSTAERAAADVFNSFKKRTLSPGTVMDRAVKSLHGSKNATWAWDEKGVEARDDDENRSTTSESVPDDERMMSLDLAKSKSQESKSDAAKQYRPKVDTRDEELECTAARELSDTPPRPPPSSAKPPITPLSEPSSVNPPTTTPRSEASTPMSWSSPGKREEVDVFRQRLESVQKKRSERQAERSKQSTRPTVRFGMISI